MKKILALLTGVLLLVTVFLWAGVSGGDGPGSAASSELTAAPLNPAYLEYQQQKAAGTLKTQTSEGHALGYKPPLMDLSQVHQNPVDVSKGKGAPPAYFDWRTVKGPTAVRNQGQCGTCWAFATMGALEAFFHIWGQKSLYLSVNNMASCQWPYLLGRCDGGNSFMSSSNLVGIYWKYYKKGNYWDNTPRGALTNGKDPYNQYSHNSAKCDNRSTPSAMVDSFRWIAADPTTLKNAIMNYGPVTTALYMTESAPWWNPATATLTYPSCPYATNHMVVLVGWDDTNGVWIAKNSWGNKWGDKGYFYIKYGSANIAKYDNLAFAQARYYNKYELLYVEDLPGMLNSAGYGLGVPCYGGLVFAPSYNTEWLTAVEFYTTAPNTQYVIKVWDTVAHPTSTTVKFSGNVLFTASGTTGEMGYYTVTVPTPPALTYPHEYGVEVRFYHPSFAWPMPFAYQDASYPVDNFFGDASANTYYTNVAAPAGTFYEAQANLGWAISVRARTQW